jgi:SAM-dependent methyltransferase
MTAPLTSVPYSLENGWDQARTRLAGLERTYDPGTIRRLEAIGVGSGWRCLEVGAGAGSITRWLSAAVGPAGRVRAVDLDTRFLDEIDAPNLDVLRGDVTADGFPRGTYDLIHTRLLLAHLPARENVLDRLVAALRPGGWLVIEEPADFAVAPFGPSLHAEMMSRIGAVSIAAGMDLTWACDLPGHLHRRGLHDLGAEAEVPLVEGASAGAEFFRLTGVQVRERLLAAGGTEERLGEWSALLRTRGLWFAAWAVVAAWGRRRDGVAV